MISDSAWVTWSDWSTCSDECGSCGVRRRTRICLTKFPQCTCSGDSTTIEFCNVEICRYPRTPCCYNFQVSSYYGRFACLENRPFLGRVGVH
uniref:Thrombospondin type 1 domain protein n=1 Tax=Angiostrongylus cantonensis TaxID=6313 RepID=A0A0K0D277_ANGCA